LFSLTNVSARALRCLAVGSLADTKDGRHPVLLRIVRDVTLGRNLQEKNCGCCS
jgi:hypothetical protein